MGDRRPGRRQAAGESWMAHLRLREDHRDRLEGLADRLGGSVSEMARRALDRGLPLLEESEDHCGKGFRERTDRTRR